MQHSIASGRFEIDPAQVSIAHSRCDIAPKAIKTRTKHGQDKSLRCNIALSRSEVGLTGDATLPFPDEIFTWVRFGQFANSAYKQFGIESKLIVRYLLDNGKLRVGQLVTMFSTNLFLLSNEVSPMASRTAISPGLLSSGEDLESLEEVKQLLQEQRQVIQNLQDQLEHQEMDIILLKKLLKGSNSAAPESF
ncbi:RNA polymerase III subunit C82 [Puccinia graminis f. sp. tritici]|uniref:RNA polymerase III subunit C82 n=1 Tax=Puccinia graminis f. sp. tritici TaxID=56615 RepID=A0A5B0MWV1_PUCGR|nr:RNA polymerase III subunit C82 [Puccinia graminis f. sp. tritici]